jgi:hypothetical protein
MATKRRRSSTTDICITVERDGIWIYGNTQAFRRLAKHMARLADSPPSKHYELHVRWHLGSHRTKGNDVFVLLDGDSLRAHGRRDFEVTFMVMEPSDMKALRRHERSGRLPRTRWHSLLAV